MSVFPWTLDDDSTIFRVDDNVTEIAGQNFNQVRDAVFKIEEELGTKPSGTKNDLKEFLETSHNSDGSIKGSALAAIGLVTLPIDDGQVGTNAGIQESKLDLDYNTSDLRQMICQNSALLNAIKATTDELLIKVNAHIAGGPAKNLRHVSSHIDLNDVPSDTRDPLFVWSGIKDREGNIRSATNVSEALQQINDELVDHENSITNAHEASAISVDTTNFVEVSREANNVQKALEELDNVNELSIGTHRAIMHSSGIPADARSQTVKEFSDGYFDGYGEVVVSSRAVQTFVASSGTAPIDDVTTGDKVIKFTPPTDSDEKLKLDAEFSQVKPGDIIKVHYGDGYDFEAQYIVESLRYVPDTDYFVRINANNLLDTEDAYARIERSEYDPNVYGVAIVAPSNAAPIGNFPGFYSSVTVADPRCASVLGIGFESSQIDSDHYKLYLQMYPTGNPLDLVVDLPAIDISGNLGMTPGKYTLDQIVLETNNAFRAAGYNFRFLAFQYEGNFGIAMSDPFDGASFSIVSGDWSSGTGTEGSYTENIIGDVNPDNKDFDALGLGQNTSNWASPAYRNSYVDSTDAQNPTKIIIPRKNKYYISNGTRRDFLRSFVGTSDGYWDAQITSRVETTNSIEVSYTINSRLDTAGLEKGKTITVLPSVDYNDSLFNENDYGRFIIKDVTFQNGCPGDIDRTIITIINGVHSAGNPKGTSSAAGLNVRIYFSNDTVGFDLNHMIDGTTPVSTDYHRIHEIYVTEGATTFSHERARMPIQFETGTLLETRDWHIRNVSSKFRGYRDSGSSALNKYIRLKVLSYDSTSGEIGVQIGERDGATNVLNPGETVIGRKNVPFKVYDETGNDYIEIEFVETSIVATAISINKVVDIEIFPSLELDDEVLLLATCELNWSPSDDLLIDRVTDRRPVGSISEKEFTQSAKDFITSGDRSLHTNGIIKGLDYVSVGSDPATLLFNGGSALVDGSIVIVNNGKAVIPELVPEGGSSGSTVDWVICIDKNGNFISLPLTSTKQQFYAEAGTGGGAVYFLPSVTFAELVNERKDLTPLLVVTATITSVSLSDIIDVRKFVKEESKNIPIVWSQEGISNFASVESLKYWISKSESVSVIKVKGEIDLDTQLDLSGLTSSVIFEGEDAVINITSSNGIILGNNQTFKDITFNYNPLSPTYDLDGDIINFLAGGCLVRTVAAEEELNNIVIDNCTFNSEAVTRRPPFITISAYWSASGNSGKLNNLKIINNEFNDNGGADNNAAIVVCGIVGSSTVSEDPKLKDCYVQNNVCKQSQSISVGTGATSSANIGYINQSPLNCENVHISRNKCGAILTFFKSSLSVYSSGIFIGNNTTHFITNAAILNGIRPSSRTYYIDVSKNAECDLFVSENIFNSGIFVNNNNSFGGDYENGIIKVNNNNINLDGGISNFTPWSNYDGVDNNLIALYIANNGYKISNNVITHGENGETYEYGIVSKAGAGNGNIINNIVEGFSKVGINSLGSYIQIQCNKIRRKSFSDIEHYIDIGGTNYSNVSGNELSNSFIDSAETNFEDSIIATSNTTIVTNNTNHMREIGIPLYGANYTDIYSDEIYFSVPTNLISIKNTGYSTILLASSSGASDFIINLNVLIPETSKLLSLKMLYDTSSSSGNNFTTGANLNIKLERTDSFGSSYVSPTATTVIDDDLDLTTLTPNDLNLARGVKNMSTSSYERNVFYYLKLKFEDLQAATFNREITLSFTAVIQD